MNKLYTQILLFLNYLTAFGITTLPPTATISGGTTLCQNATGSVITFSGNGGTAPYTFNYNINGVAQTQIVTTGTNNTVTLPIVTSAAGTFTYTLVNVSDSTTPTVVIPQNGSTIVNVNAPPAVNFTFTNNNSCSGTVIQFSSSVTGTGSFTYLWDFGDGTPTSTAPNPNHTFTSLGCGTATFNVVLTVTSNGCSVSRTNQILVKQKPDINFSDTINPFNPFSNCSNASSNPIYTINVGNASTSTCISSFSINWGDGIIESNVVFPISHTYNFIGAYSMVLTAVGNNGCVNTKTFIIKNVSNPLGGLNSPGSTQNLCAPTTNLQFSISNWGSNSLDTTYNINYGDGSPALILNQNQLNSSTYFNSTNPASSLNYPIPHTYISSSCPATSFIVTLDVTNACGTTPFTLGNISILTKPTANFTAPPTGCVNSSITFNNTTISGYGQNCVQSSIYTWNFGDGTPTITTPLSPPTNINHTFSTVGTFTVTLTAQNGCGTTTISKTICIEPPLTPTFTLSTTNGCAPLSVTATNTTNTTNSCNTPTYLWQVTHTPLYCANTTVAILNQTTANANFNFVESGSYLIRLTMTNSCGTFNSTQTVIVKKPPTASIAALSSFCGSATINPVATVTNCAPSGSTLTYAWSFPGGNPSTSTSPNPGPINYPSAGNYTVSLIVTNECGASNTAAQTLVINQSPVITNTNLSQTICSGTATTPVNITTNPATVTFSWTATATAGISGFTPSGTTSTIPAQTISTTNTNPGTVTYVITPTIGTCVGTSVNYIITVNPAAQVNQPAAVTVCNGNTVTPNSFTTSNTTAGTTYSWTNSNTGIGLAASGNGNIPTFAAVNATNTPINATITVTPSFSGGSAICSGVSRTFIITVNPTGQVNQPNNITNCNGSNVAVSFSSSNSGGTTSYSWTNDTTSIGLPSSGIGNLNFTATNTTNTPVTATITVTPTYTVGTLNCVGTPKTFTITINPSAQVNQPTAISVCNGSTIPTTNFSTQNTTGTTTYTWTNSNPAIGLAASGTGDIPAFTAVNNGTTILSATIIVTPSILIGTTSCSGTTKQFAISVLPNANLVATTNKVICNGTTSPAITFSSTTTGGTTSYGWTNDTPGIGLAASGNGNIPIFTAINIGLSPITATISVTPSFTNGSLTCSGTPQTFTITVNPSAQVNTINNIEVCNGNTITATVFSTSNLVGSTTYSWTNSNPSIGLATSGNGTIPSFTANNTTTAALISTVTVTPTFTHLGVSCTGPNKTFIIKVNPSPTATITGSVSVCLNATNPQITFTGSSGNAPYTFTYNLNGGTNQTISTTSGNSISINAPTNVVGTFTYNLINVQDSNATSCLNTLSQSAIVTVNNAPIINSQPLTTQNICVGGTIAPLNVAYTGGVGTATYQWFSNNTNTNSGGTAIAGATNAFYTPAAFTTTGTYYYYATITLSGNGCGNTTSSNAEVVVIADPVVSTQPLATQTLCQSSTPTDLTISVSGGIGTISYQWYSNTTNSNIGGTIIASATNSTYTPPTSTVGTRYYYCIVAQSGVGCNVTSAVSQVIIVAAPAITTQPASSSVCENGTPTLLTVAFTNGTGTPTYQWFSNTNNSTIGGTAIAGATSLSYNPPATAIGTLYYYCEITFSSGGCTSILSNIAQVVINPLPTVSTQPLTTQNICVGGTIAPLNVAYTGGVGTATYQWFSNNTNTNSGGTAIAGATNAFYTPAAFTTTGTYYYYATITLSGNGCGNTTSSNAEVVVIADPVVSTQPLATQTLCQSSTPTDLTISVSGGIGTISYQWYSNTTNSTIGGVLITGAINNTYTPISTTVGTQYYYCVVTQSGVGCNVTSAISQVIIVAAPAITTQPASSSVCENGTPTLLTIAFTNGTGTPTYQWFSNTTNSTIGGTAIAGATTVSYNPPATAVGTLYYYCQITFSSGGCTSILSNTAQVVINQIPVVNNVTAIICSGEQYIFNSTNSNDVLPVGLQYSWNLISMTPAGTVSGSANNGTLQNQFSQQLVNNSNGITTLVYEVTPIAGICTGNPFTITIEVYPRPDVTFDLPIQTICNETNTSLVTLNSSLPGNITYNWTATIPTGITGTISSGTNIIPVQTLINSTNLPLTITYSATATFNNNGSSCEGNVYTYSITVNPTLISSGVVSNYNGYNVSVFGANDGSINLTTVGGSGTYTYSWTGPNGYTSTNEDISGLFAGTYTVTINDGYCAPIILTFTLTQPPELLIQPDLNLTINLICYGDNNGAVGVLITQESVPPYDYELYNSSGILVSSIIDSTNLNPQFTGLIAGIYSLKVIDANGGQKTVTGLTVTQPNDIIITTTTTPITCYGANNASITLTVTGGTGPYQAQWDNLATGFYQNNLAAANYSILVTDSNGCTKTIVVNIPEAPIFTINPVVVNISCYGANDGSINLNLIGGIQPISLTWSDGSTAGLVRNNLVAGTYTVTIIDSKPCTIVRTFIIIEPQSLVLSANVQNALNCNNANSGAINLLVSGGTPPFTYSWTNGTTTEDLINIPSGNYAVIVTDSRGCTKTAQYSVNRPLPLTLNVETDTNVNCETREISQIFKAQVSGGVPPIQLSWSSGTVSGSNNEFMTTDQDGLVVLTATDALGCTTTYSLNVDIPVLGNASFNQTSNGYTAYGIYSILDPIQFTNTATGDYVSILWNFGDGTFSNEENPIHTYVLEGDYVVTQTVTYPFGCVYVQTISLLVEKGYLLVVPTGFTPNNDSLNDTYRPVTKGLKNVRLTIYDTWGSLIYSETGDVLRGWDGTIKGVNAENGNYHCKVSADTFYGSIIEAEETFVLIK